MKLPNAERAIVPDRKITHYLLSTAHRDGQHKAEFFPSFGFKLEAWEELAAALLDHARQHEVVEIVPTPFGRNFVVEGALAAPDGRSPQVRGVWFIAKNAETATGNGYISHGVSIEYLIMIKELDSVVLTTDLPEHGLAKDDIGTVVLVHEGGKGCTVEFMTLAGKTLAVVTLLADQIRQIGKDEIAHARHVAVAA